MARSNALQQGKIAPERPDHATLAHATVLAEDKLSAKLRRIIGRDPDQLRTLAAVQADHRLRDYGVDWWFSFKIHPSELDLIDRTRYLQAVHHTNLVVVYEEPFVDPDACDIFAYDRATVRLNQGERDREGRFVAVEDDHPF